MPIFTCSARLRCAALMALTGGAVAQTMSLWGGDLARFLPPLPVMQGFGVAGAGLAGLVLADAFGRAGWRGAVWSCLAWPLATIFGAVTGAALLAFEVTRSPGAMLIKAVSEGAPLGIMALMDGIATSPAVATIWLASGLAMHSGARVERDVTT